MRITASHDTERGSVLVYVFVAIAMLGALTFVVSNSTSGYVDTGEADRIKAQGILSMAQSMSIGAIRIYDRGLTLTDRSMASPTSADYGGVNASIQIFHPNGGGISYLPGGNTTLYERTFPDPHPWLYGGNYFIRTNIAVPNVGSAAGDIVVFILGINERICTQINSFLHDDPAIPTISQQTSAFGAVAIAAISDTGNVIDGNRLYCVRTAAGDGFDTFLFYQVALAR